MPQPRDKGSAPISDLPNPDLNPMLNPTLSRNLGRWAEVYFTTPPERREEAVEELLRELEGTTEQRLGPALEPTATRNSPPPEVQAYTQTCQECGQGYQVPQRYCGMCGAPLLARVSPLETHVVADTPSSHAAVETAPLRLEPIRDLIDIPADRATTASSAAHHRAVSEIPWLREKSVPAEARASQITFSFSHVRWYAAAIVVVAIAALFYAQSNPSKQGSTLSQPLSPVALNPPALPERAPIAMAAPAKPSVKMNAPQSNGIVRPAANLQKIAPAIQNAPSRASTQNASSTPIELQQAPISSPAGEMLSTQASSNAASGSAELAQAENYLNGTNGVRDSAAAARLLWAAVGKENITAVLQLSDMYLVGDGVPKSCDQAKVLLSVAARKQSAQAANKLRNLEQSGCP